MRKLAIIARVKGDRLEYRSVEGGWTDDPLKAQKATLEQSIEEIGRLGVRCGVICWVEGEE